MAGPPKLTLEAIGQGHREPKKLFSITVYPNSIRAEWDEGMLEELMSSGDILVILNIFEDQIQHKKELLEMIHRQAGKPN